MNYTIRVYLLPVIFSVLLIACNERVIVSDADSLNLSYRVKTLKEDFYFAHNSFNNLVLQNKLYTYKYEFNKDCSFNTIEKEYFYNTKLVCEDSVFENCDTIKIDSVNNSFPFVYKEPEYYKLTYNYTSDSLVKLLFYNKNGDLISYINRIFTDSKLSSEEKYWDTVLISKSKYWYNTNNQLANKTVFYRNNYYENSYVYSLKEKLETDNEFNYRYVYNIKGQIVNKKTYRGTSFISEVCYYYNKQGDLILEQYSYKNGEIKKTLYDYTYDNKNNWILCIEYNCTGNIFVKKREITYYR